MTILEGGINYFPMSRLKYMQTVFLLAVFCFSPLCVAHGEEKKPSTITIGIFPYLNPTTLFKLWDPMRVYLEKTLKQKVSFQTAPDYKTFVQRTRKGNYNYIITACHFSRLNQKDSGFKPFLAPKAKLYGIFVVKEGSPIHRLADLKGKTIATPDPLAVITFGGLGTLKEVGITDEDLSVKSFPSHNSAIMSVQRNQSDVGLCSVKAFKIMRQTTKVNLRIVGETDQIPYPVVFMANPSEDPQKVEEIGSLLSGFFANTEQGRRIVEKKSYKEMIIPVESDLAYFDPMLPKLRKLIHEKAD